MSKEKQIDYKEFARQMRQTATVFNGTEPAVVCSKELWEYIASMVDSFAGYRKQSEGGWIDNYNGTFTCTVCGGRASKMNYCGRCGAKMRKHEEVKDYPPYLDRPKMKGGAE